jgi:hypothetical protein
LNPVKRLQLLDGHTPALPRTTAQFETKVLMWRTLIFGTNTLVWPGVGVAGALFVWSKSITEIYHLKGVILIPRASVVLLQVSPAAEALPVYQDQGCCNRGLKGPELWRFLRQSPRRRRSGLAPGNLPAESQRSARGAPGRHDVRATPGRSPRQIA